MMKTQKKWIALLVLCTFVWLLRISSMPVAAAGTTEQVGSASAEQGPGYFEAVTQKAVNASKKSTLLLVLIGAGVLAVTAVVLFLVVLKKNYDIRGTWKIEYVEANGTVWYSTNATFTGTKESGTVVSSGGSTSTYTVADKTVSWLKQGGWAAHTATFTDEDTLSSGIWDWGGGYSGNFNGTRIADAAAIRNLAATGALTPPKEVNP